tara:strand:- start:198 stop:983 length:786 start_codon:yes stop_codon:yes gene_type:complete
MAWFDSAWSHRLEVAVNASGSGSFDVTITIGSALSRFWDEVLSSGADIRVTYGDGKTVGLVYQLQTWDYANKSAVIEVQAFSAGTTNAAVHQLHIYCGNAAASSGAGSFTASSAKVGKVSNARPRALLPMPGRPQPGEATPRVIVQKSTNETITLWFDINPVLASAVRNVGGRNLYEEIAYVTLDVELGGSSQAALFDLAFIRFVGRSVRVQVKAGVVNTDYTVLFAIAVATPNEPVNATTAPVRVEEHRIILRIKDPDET